MKTNRSNFLCGFMGAGKSTLIKEINSKEDIACMDLDLHIESLYGPINNIFGDKGESYFRSIEQEEFFKQVDRFDLIALGGGAVENDEIYQYILKSDKAIYLEVDFNTLWERIENSNRPLVKFGKESARGLFEKRKEKYQSLKHILSFSSEETSYTAVLNALELNK
tara:strand:+ start:2077 stop:2574 length:498 start_codon:yes stop_codon:yes gene_type:complete